MSGDPYDILGVKRGANDQELKDAMREKAKDLHPDRNPDSKDEFQQMMAAYDLLTSPSRRKRYDKTGQWDKQKSFESRFSEIIQAVFIKIAEDVEDAKKVNPVLLFKDHVRGVYSKGLSSLSELEAKIEKLNEVRKRISYDGDEENLIIKTLDLQLRQYDISLADFNDELELVKKIQEVLEYYDYDIEKVKHIGSGNLEDFVIQREQTGPRW